MLHGTPPTHPIFLILGFGAFLLCGLLAARKMEAWRKAQGFAPAPSLNREGNGEWKKLLWRNMPMQVQREIRVLQFVGFALAIIGMWLAA